MLPRLLVSLIVAGQGTLAAVHGPSSACNRTCKCLPQDSCWPRQDEWSRLNRTVGGRLVATVPLGSPCHDPQYNEEACAALRKDWLFPIVHIQSTSSVMAPLFANQSCEAFQPRSSPCTLGNYVKYAVDAEGPKLLSSKRIGSGVLGYEAAQAAHRAGLVIVSGGCPSVGLAGGYIQGGGHSALSSVYGLAADNTLSFDVVLTSGRLVTASRSENKDLYWALSGGGGGTYGIVVSVTIRAHPGAKVGGASFSIEAPQDNASRIYDVLDEFHAAVARMADQGGFVFYSISKGSIHSQGLTFYNKTKAEVQAVIQPFLDSVSAGSRDLVVTSNFTEFPSYLEHYVHYVGPLPGGNLPVGTTLLGGRLIPRSVLPSLSPTVRQLVEMGVTFNGFGINVTRFGQDGANSVLPQWRDSIVSAVLMLPFDFDAPIGDMLEQQNRITRDVQPVIEAATPGSGAYMNEGDFQQRDFQSNFFGANYPRLRAIKRRYDPEGMLYGVANVGSEDWVVGRDGRMCRSR
ncbi:FAD binding domain-containing protein [Ophiocordyceps sinensis CO18]|uniref:FAD binding domain-containing protein n=1 Tax=Ophiocordyceps sinensis (strain Co18 / CGMCC 3.14243) TaxID=911162 RepID=T5AIA4_OPHSC|nr:FAD binding domain-containing protein [Ophiocordyceps sinensis CO18]